jgi:hypothetical protein
MFIPTTILTQSGFRPQVGLYRCGLADIVTVGNFVQATWTYLQGDALLNLSAPTTPTVLQSGHYVVYIRQFLVSAQQPGSYMGLQLTGNSFIWGYEDQAPMFAPAVLGAVPMNISAGMALPTGADITLYKANGGASDATLNADAAIFYYGPCTIP